MNQFRGSGFAQVLAALLLATSVVCVICVVICFWGAKAVPLGIAYILASGLCGFGGWYFGLSTWQSWQRR